MLLFNFTAEHIRHAYTCWQILDAVSRLIEINVFCMPALCSAAFGVRESDLAQVAMDKDLIQRCDPEKLIKMKLPSMTLQMGQLSTPYGHDPLSGQRKSFVFTV